MKVKLLNPEEVRNLFVDWGTTSACCYGSDLKGDLSTDELEKIGRGCMNSGHYSGSRGNFIKFYITDVPRFTIDQAVRASIGVFTNVQSLRYCSKDTFSYEIPKEIKDNATLLTKYVNHMQSTMELYQEIESYIYNKTGKSELASEEARYLIPMSVHGNFVMGFTIEALIHFCNVRLCVRAEDKIQEMARLMRDEVLAVLPELKDKLVSQCQALLYCPEHKSCGAYPKKKKVKELIELGKTYSELLERFASN